jgi:hypothetical protein
MMDNSTCFYSINYHEQDDNEDPRPQKMQKFSTWELTYEIPFLDSNTSEYSLSTDNNFMKTDFFTISQNNFFNNSLNKIFSLENIFCFSNSNIKQELQSQCIASHSAQSYSIQQQQQQPQPQQQQQQPQQPQQQQQSPSPPPPQQQQKQHIKQIEDQQNIKKIEKKQLKPIEEQQHFQFLNKMKSFSPEQLTDIKHVIYNLLVDNYNDPINNTFVQPFKIKLNNTYRYGFFFNEKENLEKRLAELYAWHVKKGRLDLENYNSSFVKDLYKFYLRAFIELLAKYFEKCPNKKYAFLYDNNEPLFIPGESLENAEIRIKNMKTRLRKKKL